MIHRCEGPGGDLHGLDLPMGRKTAWRFVADRPTIVLGSAQSESWLDAGAVDSLGADVVVRRSGGGMVLLVPGEHVWIDITVPREDALWDDDISKSFDWLGNLWASQIKALDPSVDATVHSGKSEFVDDGRVICHAGIGAGEVVVGDSKIVGLSQRRTRMGARFQCILFSKFDPEVCLSLMSTEYRSLGLRNRLERSAYVLDNAVEVGESVLAELAGSA